jgi:nucleoside-diphosphate-sugar epimerase
MTSVERSVFVAGATGVIGRHLVPMLVGWGHVVTGTTRSDDGARWLESVGAKAAVVDVFDASGLQEAMDRARPQVVIDQLTALRSGFGTEQLDATTRLRVVGTRNLADAMLSARAERLVAQSVAWLYASGPLPHREEAPLRDPVEERDDPVLPGIVALERLVMSTRGFEGLVLRYGYLYGPGTGATSPRMKPSVHIAAAARAAVLAVDRGAAGPYNIVDDGDEVSNAKARELLGWDPMELDTGASGLVGPPRR